MNEPFHNVAHGSPDAFREFIAEMAGLARIQAELAETFAAIGDDTGLEYAVRRLAAYTKAALDTLADLKKHKMEGAREHL